MAWPSKSHRDPHLGVCSDKTAASPDRNGHETAAQRLPRGTSSVAYPGMASKRIDGFRSVFSPSPSTSAPHHAPASEPVILVFGETGVGKSTFINALANYLSFSDIDSVDQGNMKIMIPTQFSLHDFEATGHGTMFKSGNLTLKSTHESTTDNEQHIVGRSSTQSPRTYILETQLDSGRHVSIRIIDTPGLGDTRGFDQDRRNVENIIGYLSHYDNISAVFLLLKSDVTRTTIPFKFCFKELLKNLHKRCANNVMFMLTHSRSSFFRNGDTISSLTALLEEIKRESGVEIPIANNVFMIDNEAFRFLVAKHKMEFSDTERNQFRSSWEKSTKTSRKLIQAIAEIEPCETESSVFLLSTRRCFIKLCKFSAHVTKLEEATEKSTRADIAEAKRTLTTTLNIPVKYKLSHSMTVCTNKSCTKVMQDQSGQSIIDYVVKCNPRCTLADIHLQSIGDPRLRFSPIMVREQCRTCSHSFREHMNIDWDVRYESREIASPSAQRQLAKAQAKEHAISKAIQTLEESLREIQAADESIRKVGRRLASYLTEHSISPLQHLAA
ncbi:uncharacterized protein BJ171DRAFT_512302 [Polychytrium aggregatum]|uniref:uncharacterized protein n=1 Tax=Polychytrium aggregatum TaxID=110093 RepID=UPI0022FF1BAD|nr:uncharacterized protein BJ171DRAFT_512302 [Polychytrium aggregatum]KAI9202844.1 hypothetical protein BJ171DRAFT_512302 [Polychytrium aggregatum]